MTLRLPLALLTTFAATALALPAAGVAAAPRDRDHDRMPDRWERANGLKQRVNDARRDRDHDGLANLAEYRAGLDPRDADSDEDGVRDGSEGAGTVLSFVGGVLTIKEFGGDLVVGRVTADTDIECDDDDDAPASLRSDDDDDDYGDEHRGEEVVPEPGDDDEHRGEHVDRPTGPAGPTNEQRDDDDDDEPGHDVHADDCGPEALVPGAKVVEAALGITRAGRVWREVDLG